MTVRVGCALAERCALVAALVIGLTACSDQTPPAVPGSFDRPTKIAFACIDVNNLEEPEPVALEKCKILPSQTVTTRYALHALIVQSSRGEVAAVDLDVGRTLDSRQDIPGYTFVPVGELPNAIVVPPFGPDDPTAAATSDFTYVANAGSRDITVLRTRAFRKRGVRDEPTLQTVPLPGDSISSPEDLVLSPDGDALFVSLPDAGRLLRLPICGRAAPSGDGGAPPATDDDAGVDDAPDASLVPPPPSSDCPKGHIDTAAITELPLAQSLSRVAQPAGDAPEGEPYAKLCAYDLPDLGPSSGTPALPDDASTTTPKPAGLAVDAFCAAGGGCTRRLLVADQALPLIHAIDLDALASGADPILAPIVTGATTRAVVVTPPVPVTIAEDSELTQYVYAIDATDGSVLATQNGRVLQVGTSGDRPDRITLGTTATANTSKAAAISLSVLTPAYDAVGGGPLFAQQEADTNTLPPDDPAQPFCRDELHPSRSNRRLRGVFLSVGQSDGSVRVVDIHDMDLLACRNTCEAGNAAQAGLVDPFPLIRNRMRIVTTLPEDQEDLRIDLAPESLPQYEIDNETIPVRFDGSTSDTRANGLACITCPERQGEAYPTVATREALAAADSTGATSATTSDGTAACDMEREARVCALADPWAELDLWDAIYEGVVPGSRGGQGRFVDATANEVEFSAEVHFCALGVLGTADLGGPTGDQLTITGDLPSADSISSTSPGDDGLLDRCRELVTRRDDDNRPIAFEILEAYDDHLVVDPRLIGASGRDRDAELVDACFARMLLDYQVRVRDSYLVIGQNRTGFVHRVVRRDDGRCVVDAGQAAQITGRAYADTLFDNGLISFQVRGEGGRPPPIDSSISFLLDAITDLAVMDATQSVGAQTAVVPTDLRWSPSDSRLYLIDVASRGLVPIPVDPYPTAVTSSLR